MAPDIPTLPDAAALDIPSQADASAPDSTTPADVPPVDMGRPSQVVEIFAGNDHSCAVLERGDLKCWGRNDYGQLGLGDTENRGDEPGEMGRELPTVDLGGAPSAEFLRVGGDHNCIFASSTYWCWGRNDHGQLGLDDREHRGDDPGEMGAGLVGTLLGPVTTFSAVGLELGDAHTCAERSISMIECWGFGGYGQLGRGDASDLLSALGVVISIGPSATTASFYVGGDQTCSKSGLTAGSTYRCFGRNDYGQLGLGDTEHRGDEQGEMGEQLPVVDLGIDPTQIDSLSVGRGHVCARSVTGVLKCWGKNSSGQLGLGDTEHRGDDPGEMGEALPAIAHGSASPPLELGLGDGHTCVRFENGAVKCWGDNSSGQLGLGDNENRGDAAARPVATTPFVDLGSGRSAIRIAAGRAHTCALLDDGVVKCWGDNSYGQLGRGDLFNRGDGPGEMGDALPGIDLGR